MSDDRAFLHELREFADKDVSEKATITLQEAAQRTFEAVSIGNAFGPGAPVQYGFLRASFSIGLGSPEDGPSTPPHLTRNTKNAKARKQRIAKRKAQGLIVAKRRRDTSKRDIPVYPPNTDFSALASLQLGVLAYYTTMAFYAEFLETLGLTRRHGPPQNIGRSTTFVAPVEARFDDIVQDAAKRAGYGE